jgi:hypothetical protein
VHPAHRRARSDAQFLDEVIADPLVDRERVGLPASAVEREYQQLVEALAQRILGSSAR